MEVIIVRIEKDKLDFILIYIKVERNIMEKGIKRE